MKSAAETLTPTRVKLTVEVPFDELQSNLTAAYRKIGAQIQVPGFRKGKVPPAVVDQRIGRGVVLDEAVNDALPKLYVEALQENDLQPLGQPEVDVTKFEDGDALEFTAEVDVRPDIELPDYTGLQAQVDAIEVSDDDVEEQLQGLRERFGSLIDVDRSAADGDFVTIDLSASEDGTPIEEAQAAGLSYEVGKGTMVDGLDEALRDMSAGESATFSSVLMGGDKSGQAVDIEVTVQAVQEQELPDLDDEFAQTASEFDTVEVLRDDLREKLTRGKRLEQAGAARDAVLAKLLTMVEVPLPDAVLAEELTSRREQIAQQLAQAGVTQEEYLEQEEQTPEVFESELTERVRDALAAQFVLEKVATTEQLGVSEGDLSQHIVRRAQQAGVSPDQYAQHAVEHDHISLLVSEVVRGKALAMIVEKAEITDTAGERVELETLQPDGTYADPAEVAAAEEAAAAELAEAADQVEVEDADAADADAGDAVAGDDAGSPEPQKAEA